MLLFHAFFVHRPIDVNYAKVGNGTLVSVTIKDSTQIFLLTCCHNFMSEDRETREKMEHEDFKIKLTKNCKIAKLLTVTGNREELKANDVLSDCQEPDLCFDQVQRDPALQCSKWYLFTLVNFVGISFLFNNQWAIVSPLAETLQYRVGLGFNIGCATNVSFLA